MLANGGGQPQPNANPVVNGEVHDLLEVVQPLNRANETSRQNPAANPSDPEMQAAVRNVYLGIPEARSAAQPVNPQGNRLNVNRVDNRAGLVTESRDPARQNAVIHKSYIKK
jgi:hypothetical protein